jgi:hypothetical protein
MTGKNCDLFTHNQSRSYLNHLVYLRVLHGHLFGERVNIREKLGDRNLTPEPFQ